MSVGVQEAAGEPGCLRGEKWAQERIGRINKVWPPQEGLFPPC